MINLPLDTNMIYNVGNDIYTRKCCASISLRHHLSQHFNCLPFWDIEIYYDGLTFSGYLDLELADWKDNRAYRVAAFDRGHLSFVDETYVHDDDESAAGAVVLITNPLDAQFLYGHKISGALEAMAASTHVRALVFPPPGAQIIKVEAHVDSEETGFLMVRAEEGKPLYVAEWTPAKYVDGRLHNITGKNTGNFLH